MSQYNIFRPLSQERDVLLGVLVEMAEQDGVFTISYHKIHSPSATGAYDYQLSAGSTHKSVEKLFGDPIADLHMLGFVQVYTDDQLFLNTLAFERVDYQKKGVIRKWIARIWSRNRDVLLIVTATLTFLLTILQVVQITVELMK